MSARWTKVSLPRPFSRNKQRQILRQGSEDHVEDRDVKEGASEPELKQKSETISAVDMKARGLPLWQILTGAFGSWRAGFLLLPIGAAVGLSFLNFVSHLPEWYTSRYATVEVRARVVTGIWLSAAVLMSFLFSHGTLRNILKIARAVPQTLCGDSPEAERFWGCLRRAQYSAIILLGAFLALFGFSLAPLGHWQDLVVIITGMPLVALITFGDWAMYQAFQCVECCTFKTEEEKDASTLRKVLGESGRILLCVDVVIFIGLIPITCLKVYWTFFGGAGLAAGYALGFAGGAIAMHLVLGNLMGLVLEFLDRKNFFGGAAQG
jgi:hypothetical protein